MVARLAYNEVFERLVTDTDDIEGFIAYGLYKQAKREWLIDFHEQNRRAPKAAEFAAYNACWTDTSLQALRAFRRCGKMRKAPCRPMLTPS